MSTSGSIDFNMTAEALSTWALRRIGVVAAIDDVPAEIMRDARTDLNLMLKSWAATGPNLWRQTFGSVALSAAVASYTLSPKPFRVVEARYRNASNVDIPMLPLTRQEYVDMPYKITNGVPTQYYVDYQRTAATLYVWPRPASVTIETIQYTYQRAFDDVDAGANDLDIPQEWFETIGYNHAARLLGRFPNDDVAKYVVPMAAELLATARDSDREEFVRFEPERGRWR